MEIQDVRNRINDYETTIQGLQAFVRAITWRNEQVIEHSYSLGRRMTPIEGTSNHQSEDFTPDATIQIEDSLGYIVEAKRSLASNQEYWEHEVDQLLKYSQSLGGWWTDSGEITTQNVTGLVWIKYISDFSAYLETYLERHKVSPTSPLSLVEFSIISDAQEIVFLRMGWGQIDDDEMYQRIKSGIPIPLELLKRPPEKQLKFYDQKPITEYLMVVLWNDLFTASASELVFDKDLRSYAFEASPDELATELQRLYGSEGNQERDRRFPRAAWVRDALDAFVRLDLAEKSEHGEKYLIKFRTTLRTGESGDLVDRFSKHRTTGKNAPRASEQLDLF